MFQTKQQFENISLKTGLQSFESPLISKTLKIKTENLKMAPKSVKEQIPKEQKEQIGISKIDYEILIGDGYECIAIKVSVIDQSFTYYGNDK